MNILALPRYTSLGASSRVRFFQYFPWLEQEGIHVAVAPLFKDSYVTALQQQRRRVGSVMSAYSSRLRSLWAAKPFDLLWIEKELLPWIPADLERWLLDGVVPYVLDYDDAVFHSYDEHRSSFVRRLLTGKHPALMRGAAMVVAGNDYLADFARSAGAMRVEILPSVIDLDRYVARAAAAPNGTAAAVSVVGWVGQRSTAAFLMPYAELFRKIARAANVRFTALGIDAPSLGLPMEPIAWTAQSEALEIRRFDIGIMPLPDQPFERGKCGYKIIQYMACGVPVVASPVGVNRHIVEHGTNGFLAATDREWEDAILALASDPALRHRMGQAGRRKIENEFCIQKTAPRLSALLREAAGAGRN